MARKIPIETSARHIHLSEADYKKLFGENAEIQFLQELSQPGQYVTDARVTVKGSRNMLERVAVLGPFRKNTQVEIAVTDARKLGIPSCIRQSGDIAGTPGCTLIGPAGEIEIPEGVIVAKRHIHMTPVDAVRMHVHDNDNVCVIVKSFERALIYADVVVRVNPDFRLAMHIDTDEANAFANDESPEGVILKLFDDSTYNLNTWMEELQSGINR